MWVRSSADYVRTDRRVKQCAVPGASPLMLPVQELFTAEDAEVAEKAHLALRSLRPPGERS